MPIEGQAQRVDSATMLGELAAPVSGPWRERAPFRFRLSRERRGLAVPLVFALVVSLLALDSTTSAAQEAAASGKAAEGQDDLGVRLGVRLGVGQLAVSFQDRGVWGRVAPVELSAGIAVGRNLTILGALYDAHMLAPVSDYEHVESLDLYGFGPGISYRLQPVGIVVSGSLLVARLHAAFHSYEPPLDVTSRWGLMGRIAVGQDWQVTRHWQLGFAGEAILGRMGARLGPLDAADYAYTAKGLSLLFSANYQRPLSASSDPTEPPTPQDGHVPHAGFHLGASVGLAWLKVMSSGIPEISGAGSSVTLSAGHGIGRELVVTGELDEVYVARPSYASDRLADLELHGFGPGLRWYGAPGGAFVSGTVLLSRVSFHNYVPGDGRYGGRTITNWRLVGRASIGKEWRVSRRWGFGVAVELLYGRLSEQSPPGDGSSSLTIEGGALALSGSFD